MIYLDDILLMSEEECTLFKSKELGHKFGMKELGEVKWFLGKGISSFDEGNYRKPTAYI